MVDSKNHLVLEYVSICLIISSLSASISILQYMCGPISMLTPKSLHADGMN